MTPDDYITPGQAAVAAAHREWMLGVQDRAGTPHFDRIGVYIREGVGDRIDYRRNGQYQWCGAFVGWCYLGHNGAPGLHPQLRDVLLQSNYRIKLFARYAVDPNIWPFGRVEVPERQAPVPVREWHGMEGAFRLACWPKKHGLTLEPAAGDIALTPGGHIMLVAGYDPSAGGLLTYEGNAHGIGPQGQRWEGVVRNVRPLFDVALICRPSPLDCRPDIRFVR